MLAFGEELVEVGRYFHTALKPLRPLSERQGVERPAPGGHFSWLLSGAQDTQVAAGPAYMRRINPVRKSP